MAAFGGVMRVVWCGREAVCEVVVSLLVRSSDVCCVCGCVCMCWMGDAVMLKSADVRTGLRWCMV